MPDPRQRDDAYYRAKMRERMNEQESSGGTWAIEIPQNKQLELKENMRGGICIKRLDIIPYVTSNNFEVSPGDIWWRRSYGVHRNVGVENKIRLCLALSFKQPCPIDELQAKMYKAAKTDEEKKTASAFYHKKRDLYNVIDLDEEAKGPQVWDISYHLFGKQLKTELDAAIDYKYDGFWLLKMGCTLVCRFTKKAFGEQEFFEIDRIDFEPRTYDYPDDILKEAIDLDSLLRPLTYAELEREFLGLAEGDVPPPPAQPEQARRVERTTRVDTPPETGAQPARSLRQPREAEPPPPPPVAAPPPLERTTRVPFGRTAPVADTPPPPTPTPGRGLQRGTPAPVGPQAGVTGGGDGGNLCPHGHQFGVDTDAKDECPQCTQWEACGDEYDTRRKVKSK